MTNIILRKGFFALPSVAALVVLGSGLSVNAQTAESEAIVNSANQAPVSTANLTVTSVPETVKTSSGMLTPCSKQATEKTEASNQIATNNIKATETAIDGNDTEASNQVATNNIKATETAIDGNNTEPSNQVAQLPVGIGRSTRGGSSYLGAGLNIGASGGSSGLGDGNFSVISKIGVTRSFSVRPSVILSNETTFLIPITYDFSFKAPTPFTEPLGIAPYVGVGAVIKSGDNSETAVLVTGGVDVPLNSRLTATAAVNAGFFDQTDLGFLLGVGYNFRGF